MAAVDYFLKIAGIDGDSTDTAHKGEIDIESWSWGESHPGGAATGAGSGAGAGKVAMNDFTFVMKLSKASPRLFLACAQGEHIKSAWLTAHRAGEKQTDYFLKWSFGDLLVSSYQTGASEGVTPTDQVSFRFSKIEVEYKGQKPDGTLASSIKAGWDLKTNKKI
jgi:type VI secretion system secreted protein Hcp